MNTALATPTLALASAAPGSALAAVWPLGVAALLVGLAVSLGVAAGRRGAAPTGLAAGAAGLALHLAWPAGAAGVGLEVLRWALLLPLLPALAGLWRLAPGHRPRLAVAALGMALLLAAGLDAQTAAPTPHWMSLTGLLVAAAIWLGWRQHGHAHEARGAEAAALVQQRLEAQAAELAAARQQMQRALESAEAAAQAGSSFLAAASHDLRQPAHALGLYTAALRAGPLAPEQAEIASRMQASLAALDAMFAALLDVSRIDAGAVAPQWDTVWLAPLLHRLALEWAPQAEARGLRLAVHVSDPLAVTVTDPLLLERVLRNLLANAIKYTRQGGVLLACRARSVADGARGWRIEVWDTGIGIPPAEQERVFEEFYQITGPGTERGQGLGLGLAIVQRLVRLLQLRLVLRSVPGRGSVFLLGGLASASPSTQRAAEARRAMCQLQGLAVAVLEDDDDVRDAMRRLLSLWGCRVLAGMDAQDLLRRHPDAGPAQALIADLRLADGRLGPDEARTLTVAWGRSLPLLLVSGETGHAGLQALHQARQPVLAKPVSPVRLRSWLESVAAGATTPTPLDKESP
jgi:signal transduction histidine kinase/CheY-like chemotaxis protein